MKKIEEIITDHSAWKAFLEYKISGGHMSKADEQKLCEFIESREYLAHAEEFLNGVPFPHPAVTVINKHKNVKKRTVFMFSEQKNLFLKFIAFYLMNYDGIFCENLCSFRKNLCVKTAVQKLMRVCGISEKHSYKLDVSDYFNSVDVSKLLPMLKNVLAENEKLYSFLEQILTDPFAEKDGETVEIKKGIMAGTPTSAFLANLYLSELDRAFCEKKVIYARYSDDIIVFADTRQEADAHKAYISEFLNKMGLCVNQSKESHTSPGEKWEFLGFSYHNGVIDISDIAISKMKKKMKRKAAALVRWKNRKNAEADRAVAAFIKAFNKKFFHNSRDNGITWARWYFPVINTTEGLHILDLYMQDCIRYIVAQNYSKSRFNTRYEDMKKLGYVTLVNKYYKFKNE